MHEKNTDYRPCFYLEARAGFEPAHKGFADLCLTTWLSRLKKLAGVEGFEPSHDGIRIRCLTAWRYPCEKYRIWGG